MPRIVYHGTRLLSPVFISKRCVPHISLNCIRYRCLSNPSRYLSTDILGRERQSDGAWLHKLEDTQKMFLYGHRYGTRFGLTKLHLNSREPLSPDVVHQALFHWSRRTPVFRSVIREHEGDLWFYKPQHVDINFEVFGKGAPVQFVIDECFSGFDEVNGPLWKARLIPLPDDTPYLIPETKKNFPYQYSLYFCHHHSVTDGSTQMSLIQPLIDTINDIIGGKPVNTSPLGVFGTNEEYGRAYSYIKERLLANPEGLERLKNLILKSNKTPLLTKIFPRPKITDPTTKHTFIDIDQQLMAKFVAKCKDIHVTRGTGMQMIVNSALVELAQEAGTNEDSYTLSANFTIDLRRYLKPKHLAVHGCHAHTMASVITVGKDVRKDFWRNCHELHEVNLDLIKRGKVVNQAIGRQLFLAQPSPEEFFKSSPEVTRDYAFNNLRTMDRYFKVEGEHVQLTEVLGYNAIQRFIFPFMFMIYDYRGFYRHMLSYANDWLTESDVEVIADKIRNLVEHFCSDQ